MQLHRYSIFRRQDLPHTLTQDVESHKREEKPLTKRHEYILLAIAQRRALTTPMIDKLFYPPVKTERLRVSSRCIADLKFLADHGYIDSHDQSILPTEGRKPRVHFLDYKGAEVYEYLTGKKTDWTREENNVSPHRIEHLLYLNWIRIAFEVAARKNGFVIEEWIDDRDLKRMQRDMRVEVAIEGRKTNIVVTPDAFVRLAIPSQVTSSSKERVFPLFIEADRNTETGVSSVLGRRDFKRKILGYNAFIQSRKLQEIFEVSSARVLTVALSKSRAMNLKKLTEHAGGKGRFWYAAYEQMTVMNRSCDPLKDQIWMRAASEGLFSITAPAEDLIASPWPDQGQTERAADDERG